MACHFLGMVVVIAIVITATIVSRIPINISAKLPSKNRVKGILPQ